MGLLKLVRWISSNVPGIKSLDGYKQPFGIALLTVTYLSMYLASLHGFAPDITWVGGASKSVGTVLSYMSDVAQGFGWTFAILGTADNSAKKKGL